MKDALAVWIGNDRRHHQAAHCIAALGVGGAVDVPDDAGVSVTNQDLPINAGKIWDAAPAPSTKRVIVHVHRIPLVPEAGRNVVNPCCVGGRECQDNEFMSLKGVGKRISISYRRISLPCVFKCMRADPTRDCSVQSVKHQIVAKEENRIVFLDWT